MVKLLLAKGANVNQSRKDGCTPLIISRQKGHQNVVKLLLANGTKKAPTEEEAETGKKKKGTAKREARACQTCGKPATAEKKLKKCSVCRLVRYCSTECRDGDWKVHKVVCRKKGEEEEEEEEEDVEEVEVLEKVEEVVEEVKGARMCQFCGKLAAATKEKFKKCSVCRLVRYCSRECQLGDWKGHKGVCKEAAARREGGKGS